MGYQNTHRYHNPTFLIRHNTTTDHSYLANHEIYIISHYKLLIKYLWGHVILPALQL